MRIAFFGTNNEGVPFLRNLVKDFDIRIVMTDLLLSDNWRRFLYRWFLRRKLTEDIARWKPNMMLIDQSNITRKKFINILKKTKIDLGVVATFSRIIPKDVIDSIPMGIINVHPSFLPKYRGANPLFWAIRNGEKTFGVTVHFINERIDEGDIVLQKKIPIRDSDTILDCKRHFVKVGSELLKKVINMLNSGDVVTFSQKNEDGTYYPPAKAEYRTLHLDQQNYAEMRNIIRASMDKGGAILWHQGRKIMVRSISQSLPKSGTYLSVERNDDNIYLTY